MQEMTLDEALDLADSQNLDLVEVNVQNDISLCKILNYEKLLYEQKKKMKNNKSKQIVTKEIKFHLNTSANDIVIKSNNVKRILDEGHKVKVTITLKGREIVFKDKAEELLNDFYEKTSDFAMITTPIKTVGNNCSMILSSKK